MDVSAVMKLILDGITIPTSLVSLIALTIYASCYVQKIHSLIALMVICGATLCSITLYLFPILIFNKTMRYYNEKYPKIRMFNWALFLSIIAVGGVVCYQALSTKKSNSSIFSLGLAH
jgi:hypothetical protein